jgi:signal transduction histidine kinase
MGERSVLAELEAARFLAQAGATLAQVGDYHSTLERIANLAVPNFADWFGVHIREPEGVIRRLAVKHRDPVMEALVVEIYRRYPPSDGTPYGAPHVMATGEALWLPDFEKAIPAIARDEGHAALFRKLGIKSFICVPMRSHGNVVGALTFATAESGRVYDDIHLAAATDLAARAAIAIENAQLLDAMRRDDKRKDEFLAVLAHELRNPLAPMRNAIEIIKKRDAADPATQWAANVLERQVRQLSRLVDDLLEMSRFSTGRIELRRERIQLHDVVNHAVESSRPAIERGRHELHLELPHDPIELDADGLRLAQVLSNLLNNAARYTEPGGRIRLAASLDGDEVTIRVSDNGDGIAEGMQEKIFDMFIQGERHGERTAGGLGIGLTLVRRLVELHGGTVRAFSDGLGKGSEFVVRLPGLHRQPSRAQSAAAK